MEIKLTFSKQEILQRVKAKAHKRGTTDIASQGDKAVKYAYNEQAGDDENDTFLLLSALRTSLDKLKAFIGEFLQSDDTNAADNIVDDLTSENDTFNLTLVVSSRFNKSMTQPLADLGSSYIEDDMCVAWYTPISEESAKVYITMLQTDEQAISRCFLKVKPAVPVHFFPSGLSITSTVGGVSSGLIFTPNASSNIFTKNVDLGGAAANRSLGDEIAIIYTLSKDSDGNMPIDDIMCVTNNDNAQVSIINDVYHVTCKHVGATIISLYSKHNPKIFYQVKINISL